MASLSTQALIAVLFYSGEPVRYADAANFFETDANTVAKLIPDIRDTLSGTGLELVTTDSTLALTTSPDVSEVVQQRRKDELEKPLTRAAIETLSIIAYLAPVRRADIDYVRGVNSAFILRQLSMRGLIERTSGGADSHSYCYQLTVDALTHLGVSRREELPEYETITSELASFLRGGTESQEEEAPSESSEPYAT